VTNAAEHAASRFTPNSCVETASFRNEVDLTRNSFFSIFTAKSLQQMVVAAVR
jgi:hypothetical protein